MHLRWGDESVRMHACIIRIGIKHKMAPQRERNEFAANSIRNENENLFGCFAFYHLTAFKHSALALAIVKYNCRCLCCVVLSCSLILFGSFLSFLHVRHDVHRLHLKTLVTTLPLEAKCCVCSISFMFGNSFVRHSK